MNYDCIIIGGGPAGLNAALVLGRARRNVILFDSNEPRNHVVRESHGFLTRDGIQPAKIRQLALQELEAYPSIQVKPEKALSIECISETNYEVTTESSNVYKSTKILLATGLKDEQPNVPGIERFYGTSLFSCPYCDGWEVRDQPLAVIADKNVYKLAKEVFIWSRDLIVFTNGEGRLELHERERLESRGIKVVEDILSGLEGTNGQLERVRLEDGTLIDRSYGFVTPLWSHPNHFAGILGCKLNEYGGIQTDEYGRTNVWNVYAAGDAANIVPAQLIVAAGSGSAAAIGINGDLTNELFDQTN